MPSEEEIKIKARRDAFASIAVWQILTFVFLLCFVWASELLDFPAQAFGDEGGRFSIYRACILSAAVIAAAVIAVGHTYEQQRRLLKRLLKTCMYCHRVQTDDGAWHHVEDYFIRHYPVPMKRCSCPQCDTLLSDSESRRVLDSMVSKS